MNATTTTRARTVRYVTVEPGRISLHGAPLTEAEYTVLRVIAERMKQAQTNEALRNCTESQVAVSALPKEVQPCSL